MPDYTVTLTDAQAAATAEVVRRINANRAAEDAQETARQAAEDADKPEDERRDPIERQYLTVEAYLTSVLSTHASEWVRQQA